MLILEHARGGWLNHYYGNLELLDAPKATWFAKVQRLFYPLLAAGRAATIGGLPGRGEPYGFVSADESGTVCTVVNPSQEFATFPLPASVSAQSPARGRLLFADSGFKPVLEPGSIQLGPEQMAVVGFGNYARGKWDLGTGNDIRIPKAANRLQAIPMLATGNRVEVEVRVPKGSDLRVLLRQTVDGRPRRISGGAPPDGKPLDQLIVLEVRQAGRILPLRRLYGKAIWSGLSWASGEAPAQAMDHTRPVAIEGRSASADPVSLTIECYAVRY
jgi:hypothetical protein